MNTQHFLQSFESMRVANLGKQFERRELGLLAIQYGIYINSTMWVCGLNSFFKKGKVGPKYVYSFKNIPTSQQQVVDLNAAIFTYKHNNNRTIEHAKSILRRHGIHNID